MKNVCFSSKMRIHSNVSLTVAIVYYTCAIFKKQNILAIKICYINVWEKPAYHKTLYSKTVKHGTS
jgi:hypothetical protein